MKRMKRTAITLVIMIAALVLAGCGNNSTPGTSRVKEDPRDTIIKNAVKTAISTTNPLEIAALFSNHPDMLRASPAEKMVLSGFLIGNTNGYELDLSKAKNIKLRPSPNTNTRRGNEYCLDGTFDYTGSGKGGGRNKLEIAGTGTIHACTDQKTDGSQYLSRLKFGLASDTIRSAKVVRGGK